MFRKARIRMAGALLGTMLAISACGDGQPNLPEDRGEDPKTPPPTEAMAPQAAPLYA